MAHTTATDFTKIKLASHIKTVLLDLDNTCYQYDPCHLAALQALRQAIENVTGSIPDFDVKYKEAQELVKSRIPTHAASHSRILYAQSLCELLGRTDGHIHAPSLEKVYWDTFIKTMKKVAGLDDFLANCRKSGTTVVVVSDLTTTIQCQKLIALDIAKSIDFLVTAEEAGADKPDPKPFLVALEKARGDIHTSVVIGDNHERDIKGASFLGISSIQIMHDTKNQKTPLR
jgi:FMN phosphatase YigB (HAD superfamily)